MMPSSFATRATHIRSKTLPRQALPMKIDNSTGNGQLSTSRPKIIAVIDDDHLVAEATQGLLRVWGYQVLTITSNAAAVASPGGRDWQPDLIISDYREPNRRTSVEANTQLGRWLRASIPVLLISGDTTPEHLRDLCTSGHCLLFKPVIPAILRTVIEQLLSK
jgi:CheY-like chemotaxis protein